MHYTLRINPRNIVSFAFIFRIHPNQQYCVGKSNASPQMYNLVPLNNFILKGNKDSFFYSISISGLAPYEHEEVICTKLSEIEMLSGTRMFRFR